MQLNNSELPQKAGLATLVWTEYCFTPKISGSCITLPLPRENYTQFRTLKGGEQFLLRHEGLWYGGTDEKPFLGELRPEAYSAYLSGGEESFYESLKPWIIKRCEEFWGREKTQRQGEIFAYPIPFAWKELGRFGFKGRLAELFLKMGTPYLVELFGTNHKLDGILLKGWTSVPKLGVINSHNLTLILLGEGEIHARDHKPLIIRGPHILSQNPMQQKELGH